jgi:hypothetical protein
MANNKFIEKFLMNLSLANPRLRCPLTRLHIQIEMQSPRVQSLIQYFLMLQQEYQSNHICGYNLTNIAEFIKLKDYLIDQKLLYFDEADWLEDAIHETLFDED